jgi:hypothetical protein
MTTNPNEIRNEPEWKLRAGWCGARFRTEFTREDAIELHAFAPLEALPCVCPMAFRLGGYSSYRLAL